MPASRALVVALALSGTAHGTEPCRAADDFVLSFDTATSVYNNLGGSDPSLLILPSYAWVAWVLLLAT